MRLNPLNIILIVVTLLCLGGAIWIFTHQEELADPGGNGNGDVEGPDRPGNGGDDGPTTTRTANEWLESIMALESAGKLEEALEEGDTALAEHPGHADLEIVVGGIRMKIDERRRTAEARADVEPILADAEALLAAGDWEAAEARFEEAREAQEELEVPVDARTQVGLITAGFEILVAEGREKLAAGEWDAARRRFEDARDAAEDADDHHGTDLLGRHDLDELIRTAEDGAARADMTDDRREEYDALLAEADRQEAAGELEAAIETLREARALAENPAAIDERIAGLEDRLEARARYAALLDDIRAMIRDGRHSDALEAIAAAREEHPEAGSELDALEADARAGLRFEGMLPVPAGTFTMGSDAEAAGADERPAHQVDLPLYYLEAHPVTNAEYLEFVRETGRRAPPGWQGGTPAEGTADHPVTGVSWNDAQAYAEWKGRRLPTEAELEKAMRGTDGRVFPWGDAFEPGRANTSESGNEGTVAVDAHDAAGTGPYGHQDLAGNVWEWTSTDYGPHPGADWTVPEDQQGFKVLKGGSFLNTGEAARGANRYALDPDARWLHVGFRLAADPE